MGIKLHKSARIRVQNPLPFLALLAALNLSFFECRHCESFPALGRNGGKSMGVNYAWHVLLDDNDWDKDVPAESFSYEEGVPEKHRSQRAQSQKDGHKASA